MARGSVEMPGDTTTGLVVNAGLQDNAANFDLINTVGTWGAYQFATFTNAGHDSAGPGGIYPGSLVFDGLDDRGNFFATGNFAANQPFTVSIFAKIPTPSPSVIKKIGRASCRERV